MSREKLKTYQHLPLYLVEDHNEVVPYIHRAIGSRHLPMSDLVLVHFDSHPDLLIPQSMQADTVFNKQLLYDTLSIENWILPLVYAGHIKEIVWMKPPWCHQIEDKSVTFQVGKCAESGTLRTTCRESYFVSETLYRPQSKLTDCQEVTLTVLSVRPLRWDKVSLKSENKCVYDSHSEKNALQENHNLNVSSVHQVSNQSKELKNCSHKASVTHSDLEPVAGSSKCDSADCSKVRKTEEPQRDIDGGASQKRCLNQTNYTSQPAHSGKIQKLDEDIITEDQEGELFSTEFLEQLETLFDSYRDKHAILDIDLDFYSTRNPFKVIYSTEQYSMLKELYAFVKPTGCTDKDIERCVRERKEQLDSLRSVWETLQENPAEEINHPRIPLINRLHRSILESHSDSETIDYELLHEAGCTCDDTELPHHVSSQEQITLLVDATQEILCRMKKPTLITMARSSTDDYCPPEQVNQIQDEVLDMLKDLYLEISITEDYEQNAVT